LAKPAAKIGRGLHVDRHAAQLAQVVLEGLVVFPHAAVGGVHRAGPVVVAEVADHGRDHALQREGRQRRHFRRHVVVRGALAADRGDRQDQVAELVLALEASALAQEQHRLRRQARSAGPSPSAALALPMPKLIMVMPSTVALGIGRSRPTTPGAGEAREAVQVAAEVGQQDVLAEVGQGKRPYKRGSQLLTISVLSFHGLIVSHASGRGR
jgi:hypothetical protein